MRALMSDRFRFLHYTFESNLSLCGESESVGSRSVNPEDWGQRDSHCL